MMEFWVELGDGTRLKLPKATRWKLCYGTGLPCDSFEVRCLWDGDPDGRAADPFALRARGRGTESERRGYHDLLEHGF